MEFSVGYSRFLGYDKGEDGNLAINEEQAKTVRLIFRLFQVAAGTGGAGGDDPELHRRECEGCPRPGGVAETLQRLGGAVRESQGTVRRGDGGHCPAVSQGREAATRS